MLSVGKLFYITLKPKKELHSSSRRINLANGYPFDWEKRLVVALTSSTYAAYVVPMRAGLISRTVSAGIP